MKTGAFLLIALAVWNPMAAFAQGCSSSDHVSISCEKGTVWDETARACVSASS